MSESNPPAASESTKKDNVKEATPVHTEGEHGVERATLRSYLCGCIPGRPHPKVSAKEPDTTTKEHSTDPKPASTAPEEHAVVTAPVTSPAVDTKATTDAPAATTTEKPKVEKDTVVGKQPLWKRFLPGAGSGAPTSSTAAAENQATNVTVK